MPQEFPGLFGGVARSRILFSLLLDGPQTRRGLASSLGIDPTFALQRLRSLERAGLVTRTEKLSAFNWGNPVARETARVASRYMRRPCPRSPHASAAPFSAGYLETFASPTRTRLLLAIARIERAPLGEIAKNAGITLDAARSAAESLTRAGVLEIVLERHRRIVKLNPNQPARVEVLALLEKLNRVVAARK